MPPSCLLLLLPLPPVHARQQHRRACFRSSLSLSSSLSHVPLVDQVRRQQSFVSPTLSSPHEERRPRGRSSSTVRVTTRFAVPLLDGHGGAGMSEPSLAAAVPLRLVYNTRSA